MAIALARDLRKGEDGLDDSLRVAFLGALVAGAVALVAKLCRAVGRAARARRAAGRELRRSL